MREGHFLNKYGALRSRVIDGHTFHSLLEAGDYLWLKQLQREGIIENLELQVRYRIYVNEKYICSSIVDFRFTRKGKIVWYETKGLKTDAYLIKRSLIEATLPVNNIFIENGSEKEIRMVQ
jgi:hypothetical protein